MPSLAARPFLAILAAGLVGLALGYASEATAQDNMVSGGGSAAFGESAGRGSAGLDRSGHRGGSVRQPALAVSGVATRSVRRGYRDIDRARSIYEAEGSITHVRRRHHDETVTDRLVEADEQFDGGYDAGYAEDGTFAAPGSFPSAAKIIDVARLDRQPQDVVDTIQTGSAKIIRVGADRRQRRTSPAASATGYHQPWSSGWLTHCLAAHTSFDPDLGTYVAGDGRVRFCEAE